MVSTYYILHHMMYRNTLVVEPQDTTRYPLISLTLYIGITGTEVPQSRYTEVIIGVIIGHNRGHNGCLGVGTLQRHPT